MELEYKSFNFELEVKEVERDGQKFGVISGLLATFGGDKFDRGGDTFVFGAFTDSIKEHKERDNRPIRMLFQHDRRQVIGGFPIEKVVETDKGLFVEGEINLEVKSGREAFALAKQGVISDLSIGFSVQEKIVNDEDGTTKIIKATVWEGSLVDEPMDINARFSVKALKVKDVESINTKRDFEKALRESGAFSKEAATKMASHFKESQSESDGKLEERKTTPLSCNELAGIEALTFSFRNL